MRDGRDRIRPRFNNILSKSVWEATPMGIDPNKISLFQRLLPTQHPDTSNHTFVNGSTLQPVAPFINSHNLCVELDTCRETVPLQSVAFWSWLSTGVKLWLEQQLPTNHYVLRIEDLILAKRYACALCEGDSGLAVSQAGWLMNCCRRRR